MRELCIYKNISLKICKQLKCSDITCAMIDSEINRLKVENERMRKEIVEDLNKLIAKDMWSSNEVNELVNDEIPTLIAKWEGERK